MSEYKGPRWLRKIGGSRYPWKHKRTGNQQKMVNARIRRLEALKEFDQRMLYAIRCKLCIIPTCPYKLIPWLSRWFAISFRPFRIEGYRRTA